MARKRISLSQFAVFSERDDGGVQMEHSYRQCDWREWVDGMSPNDLRRLAREHARTCDGKPQPRPPRQEPGAGYMSFIPPLWAEEIARAFQSNFVTGIPDL